MIVGSGVMGASAAFHLAEAGVEVVLVERWALASRPTSRAAGCARGQFPDALNIQIAQRRLDAFRDVADRPGWEVDLKQVGCLCLLTREGDGQIP